MLLIINQDCMLSLRILFSIIGQDIHNIYTRVSDKLMKDFQKKR